ncbi:MAG: hypothetical protein KME40_19130 [Komarekiella atlantica HA4396-MV6]|nr:hypothetical protein [Komarekiella atlantica HA4396-MV6]
MRRRRSVGAARRSRSVPQERHQNFGVSHRRRLVLAQRKACGMALLRAAFALA